MSLGIWSSRLIPRLKDIGPDPGLISDTLLGVVAQRLVRRICHHCVEPYQPEIKGLEILGLTSQQIQQSVWRRGCGCGHLIEKNGSHQSSHGTALNHRNYAC